MAVSTTTTCTLLRSSDRMRWAWVGFVGFPAAVLAFGTVHPWPRLVFALIVGLVGWRLWRQGRIAYDRWYRSLFCLGSFALGWSALAFLPVTGAMRVRFQPAIAEPVNSALALVYADPRPLALNPWRGLIEWSVMAALWIFVWGMATWVVRAQRGRRLASVVIGTGVVLIGLAVVQRLSGAETIFWFGGVPSVVREPFFGTFVNANHGGALCAALAAVAAARAMVGSDRGRRVWVLATLVLSMGVFHSGSRGAVVAWFAGIALCLMLGGGRRIRGGVLVVLGSIGVTVAVVGPGRAMRLFSGWVSPVTGAMVDGGFVDLTTGRSALLADVWGLAKGVWLVGVGPAGFADAYRVVKTTPAFNLSAHAHNDLLQLWIEHGAIVAAAWLTAAMVVFAIAVQGIMRWRARADRRWLIAGFTGCGFAIVVFSMGDFPMRLGSHALLLALSAGAVLGLSRPQKLAVSPRRASRAVVNVLAFTVCLSAITVIWGWWNPAAPVGSAAAASATENRILAIRNRPVNPAAIGVLLRAELMVGDLDGAAKLARVGSQVHPSLPWVWRDLARVARKRGDTAAAQAAWTRMLTLDLPEREDQLPFVKEAIFGAEGDSPITVARAVLPERADRWRQAARLFNRLDMRGDAEQLFRRALDLDEARVNQFAIALLRWGRSAEAYGLVGVAGGGCGVQAIRAQALLDLGRGPEASRAFTRAMEGCGPPSWSLRAGLGRARLLADDGRGAVLVARLLIERPEANGLRRALIRHLFAARRVPESLPHLEVLVLDGVATAAELKAYDRVSKGLPVHGGLLSR